MLSNFFKIIILTCLLTFTSCQGKKIAQDHPIHVKYVKELVNKFVDEYSEKYEFYCIGITWGMPKGIIEVIGPIFATNEKTDIPKARKLIIELSNDLINRINASEELRPYLANYPFNIDNIEMTISYTGNLPLETDELEFSYIKKGKIYYEDKDPETNLYRTIFKESYDDALEKLHLKL